MADPYGMHRRIGRWCLYKNFLEDHEPAVLLLQRYVLILDVRHDWATDRFEYYGRCGDFAVVPHGSEVPLYRPSIDLIYRKVSWQPETMLSAQPTLIGALNARTDYPHHP